MTDKPLAKCRKCGGRLEKLLSASAIQFKGAGWYVTDYANKKSGEAKEEKKSESTEVKTSDKATSKEQDSSKKASAPKNTPTSSGD
jgi:predicted nucleic acid-binding Zn ribbon protein